ncbi:MAG: sigma 54-interacting transcriptional regulator [Spirochaetales bacterium]|nr:sigma 54-interacting transcriptional regulator [Spirochaetales bacterium]
MSSKKVSPALNSPYAAPSRNLEEMIQTGDFREDLFYRLNVIPVEIPPLRERKEDISLLIDYFLKEKSEKQSRETALLTEETYNLLINYSYPGNVRELENILEHALIICQEEMIESHHLPVHIQNWAGTRFENGIDKGLNVSSQDEMEAKQIKETLKLHQGNRKKTAQTLGIDRTTLWRKMKRYGI